MCIRTDTWAAGAAPCLCRHTSAHLHKRRTRVARESTAELMILLADAAPFTQWPSVRDFIGIVGSKSAALTFTTTTGSGGGVPSRCAPAAGLFSEIITDRATPSSATGIPATVASSWYQSRGAVSASAKPHYAQPDLQSASSGVGVNGVVHSSNTNSGIGASGVIGKPHSASSPGTNTNNDSFYCCTCRRHRSASIHSNGTFGSNGSAPSLSAARRPDAWYSDEDMSLRALAAKLAEYEDSLAGGWWCALTR